MLMSITGASNGGTHEDVDKKFLGEHLGRGLGDIESFLYLEGRLVSIYVSPFVMTIRVFDTMVVNLRIDEELANPTRSRCILVDETHSAGGEYRVVPELATRVIES